MSRIISLEAQTITDSHGEPTLAVNLGFGSGIGVSASVPQGRSRGSFEAHCLEVGKAVENIKKIISPALKNRVFNDQQEIDGFLIALDGTFSKVKLGANAILGVSLAFARATAQEKKIPLWRHIRETSKLEIKSETGPRFFVNIIGGGLHAKNNLDFQEYLIIPKTQNADEALEISKRIYEIVGRRLKNEFGDVPLGDEGEFAPTFDSSEKPFAVIEEAVAEADLVDKIDFGLDAAASNVKKRTDELFRQYKLFKEKYNLFYLEDPFSEEDYAGFAKILKGIGIDILIVGDDLTTTNVTRMEIAHQQKSINGVIIKPNQIGTLTETLEAVKRAKEWNWAVIVSHRAGETNDDFIADLAYGVGADGLKAGAPSAPERLAKYLRLKEIGQLERIPR